MTHIRKLALVLFLALLCSSYSNSQTTSSQATDGTTNSLTNFTGAPTDTTSVWNNAGSVGAPLTCWAGGDPGYCGPNPRVSAWGAGSNIINFSYGTVDLNQVVNINKALAIGGSGVQLSGFNFGFQAKNGSGWDDGRQDYLGAYVKLYNSGGGLAANYDYTSQTNKRYNWTNFNFSETFSSPVPATNFSNAQYGFVGRDNNFWVGPYGPEITNVSFSLKYTVKPDPCISDPLSSPTCPGYALATVKNSILGSTVSNASATSFVPAINYTQPAAAPPGVADAAPALAQASPQQQAQQPPPQQQGPQPQPPGQDPNQNPAVAQDNPAQPSPQQAGPAPTNPQPAGGPPQATQTAQSAPPPGAGPSQAGPQQAGPSGGGAGPSKLAMSVVKSAQAKEQAMQQAAVQNAAKAFEATQQSSNAASNLAISMNQDMSANSATAAAQFSSQTTQASTQVAAQASQSTPQSQQSNSQQQQSNKSVQLTQQTQEVQQAQQQQTGSSLVQLQPPQQVVQQVETQSVATAKVQTPQVQETQQSQTQAAASVVQVQPPAYTPPAQQETQSTSVVMLKPPTPPATETQSQASSGTGLAVSRNPFGYNPLASFSPANTTATTTQTAPVYQPRLQERVMEVDAPQVQVASFGGIGKAGNPLSEMMMQQRFEMMQENIQQQTSTVNRNVQPNDLAGGVDLTAMATVPQGFNAYSFMIKDAAFYEPKEVYKNQKTVDNVRLLRGLTGGSDRLHQEMVDQQYK
jgi:hypothetical protein